MPDSPVARSVKATAKAKVQVGTSKASEKKTAGVDSIEALLGQDLDALWRGRALRRGTTAIYVVDARSGAVLYAVHEDALLNPASNVKLVATATALDVLGPEWRYQTRLFGPTPAADGVVTGDVYLLGNYDPTLTAEHLADLAAGLAGRGIREIRGDLVVGADGRRDSVGRPRVEVAITGTRAGEPPRVTVTPATDLVGVEVAAKTTRAGRTRLSVDWRHGLPDASTSGADELGRLVITVRGQVRAGRTRTYRRWVSERSLFTAHLLRAALIDAGVAVTGRVATADFDDYVHAATAARDPFLPVELARHQSASLRKLVAKINKRSINWLADAVLRTAGAVAYGGPPTMDKGVRAMEGWLERQAGVAPGEVRLDTGSGLSYQSALSARHITQVLRAAAGYASAPPDASASAVFRESLSVAGRDGTLRRRFHDSKVAGNMRGKTGTLKRIIALSGIVSTDADNTLLFAIVTNGHAPGQSRRVKHEHDSIVNAIYRYLERRQALAARR